MVIFRKNDRFPGEFCFHFEPVPIEKMFGVNLNVLFAPKHGLPQIMHLSPANFTPLLQTFINRRFKDKIRTGQTNLILAKKKKKKIKTANPYRIFPFPRAQKIFPNTKSTVRYSIVNLLEALVYFCFICLIKTKTKHLHPPAVKLKTSGLRAKPKYLKNYFENGVSGKASIN